MRRTLESLPSVFVALCLLGLGLSGCASVNSGLVPLATAYASKTVCSNVFIAKRDPDAVIQTDLKVVEHGADRFLKIDVDTASQRVGASFLGIFGKRYATYAEGRGCTLDFGGAAPMHTPSAALPGPAKRDALWPAGETVQLSSNPKLWAAVNDPVLQGTGMRAIVVVHDGRIIAETYGQGFDASTPLLGWSMTKTVNAALVGMVIKDGKLSLGQKALFPQWSNDARADISVADLMSMSSGLEFNEDKGLVNDAARMEFLAPDAAAFARDKALVAPPGTRFQYASGSSVLLSRIWQNAIGPAARDFPQQRLFAPLGMTSAVLEADAAGTFFGEAFLYASAHDWARFGEFLRLGGEWEGQQLLAPGFVDYMRSPVLASDQGQGPVYGRGQLWLAKGLGFPLPADTFMLNGHLRQTIAVIPSRKLVILRMGLTPEDIGYSNADLLRAILAAGLQGF